MITKQQIIAVLDLVSFSEDRWGHDTNMGTTDDLVAQAMKILGQDQTCAQCGKEDQGITFCSRVCAFTWAMNQDIVNDEELGSITLPGATSGVLWDINGETVATVSAMRPIHMDTASVESAGKTLVNAGYFKIDT